MIFYMEHRTTRIRHSYPKREHQLRGWQWSDIRPCDLPNPAASQSDSLLRPTGVSTYHLSTLVPAPRVIQLWWVVDPTDDTCTEGFELWGR